jgi:dihydroxyacetone kinase
MVNNLGATTAMELAIFGGHAVRLLQSRGLRVERVYSGAFMTSLEAAGVSLSILRVDDDRLALLDASTSAPAWPNAVQKNVGSADESIVEVRARPRQVGESPKQLQSPLRLAIDAACDALLDAEPRLTELDQATGDGDLGTNLARGAREIKATLDHMPLDNTAVTLRTIASVFQGAVGGSSGPLYAVMLIRASRALDEGRDWATAASRGWEAISELGGAKAGDRTMLDALLPFATRLQDGGLEQAVRAAEEGAQSTAAMTPRRGRASYLGERSLGHPDAGAVAVAIWLRAIAGALRAR